MWASTSSSRSSSSVERGAAGVGEDDPARAAVGRVGPALDQTGLTQVVDEVGHDAAVDADRWPRACWEQRPLVGRPR